MQDSLEDYLRISKNKKGEESIKINKELLITAQIKKECEARAQKIIEFSIEGKLLPEVFIKCLPHINQQHYQDIVEERSISKLCGYPICGKRIPEMPSKQYHISTKCNKVYDITDRKNYCSNHCYKASLHIKKQVENSPLWLRKPGEHPNFKLLPKSEGGLPGELIDHGLAKPVTESQFTSVSNFTEISLNEMARDEIKPKEENNEGKPIKKIQPQDLDTITEDDEQKEHDSENFTVKENNVVENSIKNGESNVGGKRKSKTKSKDKIPKKLKDGHAEIESEISKVFKEWITLETLIYVHGEDKIKSILDHQKLCDYFDQLRITELKINNQKRYMELCRKLHLKHIADEKFDQAALGENMTKLKPLPDYKALKEDSKNLDIKVKSFYGGILYDEKDKNLPTKKTEEVQDEDNEDTVVLPLVESNSTIAMRRKVFLSSLSKPLQSLLMDLKISQSLVLSEVQDLVKSFKLSAHNVNFKPIYWKYIVITILKIISLKDRELVELLNKSDGLIELFLNHLPGKGEFVNEILHNILDVDKFVTNFISQEQ